VEAAPLTVIRAGTLIDGQSETPRKNQLIFVRGQRVEKVADGSSAIPAGAKTIDLSSATVLPGMIDSHTHLFSVGRRSCEGWLRREHIEGGYRVAGRASDLCRKNARSSRGFTTLRDVETEGAGYGDIGIKQAIEEGTIPGPRVFGATRGISTTGGYKPGGLPLPKLVMPKGVQIVDGPVEARKAAREQPRARRGLAEGLHDSPLLGRQNKVISSRSQH